MNGEIFIIVINATSRPPSPTFLWVLCQVSHRRHRHYLKRFSNEVWILLAKPSALIGGGVAILKTRKEMDADDAVD